jgi:plastocyanin
MRRAATITVSVLLTVGSPVAASASTVWAGRRSTGDPISLSDVEEISIGGTGQATLAIGSPAELTISGPPEAGDQVAVTVDDGELLIAPEPEAGIELEGGEELLYQITVERLADIRLRDDVSLEIDGISGDDLDIELADNTTASVSNVELEELDAEVQGTALLLVTGATGDLEIDVRESGAFDGTDLAAATAEVEARDSARVVVNVSTLLVAKASDDAIVEHVGTPAQTDLDVRESGEVRAATGTLLPAAPATGSVPSTSPDTSPASGADTSVSTQPVAFEVSTAGRAFNPAVLEVAVGDTVTWINDDDTEHTVSATEDAFDSGELAVGSSFSFTFETPGEFPYRCLIHPEMQATIVVR